MSGSFEELDVPPTLVSFAVTTGCCSEVVTPEFKEAHHKVILIAPEYGKGGLPDPASLKECFDKVTRLCRDGKVFAAYTPTSGGIAVAIQAELNVPVKFIGVGESVSDLQKFDPAEFVEALFAKEEDTEQE